MEQYKEKLKLDNWILGLCAVILSLFAVAAMLAEMGILNLTPVAGDSHWQSRWRGFLCGLSCSLSAIMVYGIWKNWKALKDEKKLKVKYIRENDERTNLVRSYARSSAMSAFTILALIATVISGYFSITVSITLLISTLAISFLGLGFKLYYGRKL